MTLARIIKNWNYVDLMRQTPSNSGRWDGVQFTEQPLEVCDYLIVCNHLEQDVNVVCPAESVWGIVQEPPVPEYLWLRKGFEDFSRIYTPDVSLSGPRYHHSHGALAWHVNKTYDELKACPIPEKVKVFSSVNSNKSVRPGHQFRLTFLELLKSRIDQGFDLWGRGFQPLEDKWEGLAPYRYSLAVENCSTPHYWTEKLADCFLSWTMPIYYGATNIFDYFPQESIIWVDISRPEEALDTNRQAVASDLWLRNREAIAYARELILDKYQFFPFFARRIDEVKNSNGNHTQAKKVFLPALLPPGAKKKSVIKKIMAFVRKLI